MAAATPTPRSEEQVGEDKFTQFVVTFTIGGIFSFLMWPHLNVESKGMVGLFGVIAALSIHNGTWTANTRDLRKQAKAERKEAYVHAYNWFKGNPRSGQSVAAAPRGSQKEKVS